MPKKKNFSALPALPRRARSMDGQEVDTSGGVVRLRSSSDGGGIVTIKLERFDRSNRQSALSHRAWHLVKLYLLDRIQRRKARTVEADYNAMRCFDRWLSLDHSHKIRKGHFDWRDLEESVAKAFLAHGVRNTSSKGNDFSRLRTFYRWGVAHQYEDFNLELALDLKSIRAIGNLKGHNVRFHHPTKGPLSPDEKLLLSNACARENGENRDRAIVLLHLELGINPHSTGRIKNRDLKVYLINGISTYQVDVPRVKKRTTKRETKRRNISPRLGALITSLQRKDSNPNDPLFYWLSNSHPEQYVIQTMHRFVRHSGLRSPRTGKLLNLSPRRCRTTLATHMAEEGASKFHIAEVLDHTDLQNVGVYTETVSSIADAVAQATDNQMAPLVDRSWEELSIR